MQHHRRKEEFVTAPLWTAIFGSHMDSAAKPGLRQRCESKTQNEPPDSSSIEELLAAKKIDCPRFALDATFKKAPKSRKAAEEQMPLGTDMPEPF